MIRFMKIAQRDDVRSTGRHYCVIPPIRWTVFNKHKDPVNPDAAERKERGGV